MVKANHSCLIFHENFFFTYTVLNSYFHIFRMFSIIREGDMDFVIPKKWITSDGMYLRPPLVVNFEEYVKKNIDPEDSWSKKKINEMLGEAGKIKKTLFYH